MTSNDATSPLPVPAATSAQTGSTLGRIEFETDVQIVQLVAEHNAANTRDCPSPGRGRENLGKPVQISPDVFYANGINQYRVWDGVRWVADHEDPDVFAKGEKVLGVTLTKAIAQLNGGNGQEVWWIPHTSLRAVRWSVEGFRVK